MTDVAFPMQRTCPFTPPEEYAGLRADRPVTRARLPTGMPVWLVTRHDHVRTLLTDGRISSGLDHPNVPYTAHLPDEVLEEYRTIAGSLLALDPPLHTHRRRMLITEFTMPRIQVLRPFVQKIADERVTALLAGPRPADLVAELSLPVTSTVLCELLGVPGPERAFFEERSMMILRRETAPEDRTRAHVELREYLDGLVRAKEAAPGDDILGRLIVHDRDARLFGHELLVGLASLLMQGGHETTANMISLSVIALLEDPAQRAGVFADPPAIGPAIEELLRYFSVSDGRPRVALDDIEIGGVTIRKGDAVMLSLAAANHDESVFGDPGRLRLDRGSRKHVAFGYGAHQCIGKNLVRLELEIVLRTLFTRVPGLRLAEPADRLPFKDNASIYGVHRLPVTWP